MSRSTEKRVDVWRVSIWQRCSAEGSRSVGLSHLRPRRSEVRGRCHENDNSLVPKANAGTGSPGTSFLAAPATTCTGIGPASGAGTAITLDTPLSSR